MRTVTVTGQGMARVTPDSAVVRVAAVHQAPGVAEALSGADEAATAIVAVAGSYASSELIGSTSVQIWPAQDHEGRPAGFTARHSLTISCADIAAAGALLTALAEGVGDRLQIEGVSLEVTDQAAALTSAREAAYADAVARATHLAGLAGAELGEVQDLVEGGGVSMPIGRLAKATLEAVSLQPGETSVTGSVTAVFQLR